MAIPDPSKAGSPFSPLQTDGWNPKTPEINNFLIPEIPLRVRYALPFSRTIPVRTPQSASRTEVSRPLCHGRAPLSPGRTGRGL